MLGRGFDSVAVETDSGLVFRIGTTPDAARSYAMEHRLLAALAPHVPAPIPQPLWYTPPCDAMPFAAIGYGKLAGDVLTSLAEGRDLHALQEDIARFLLAMHRVPLDEARGWGVTTYTPDRAKIRDELAPVLRERFGANDYARLAAWWDELVADDAMRDFVPALCHNDLWYENTLVQGDPVRLAGVLDFGDVSIGDPAFEFAALQYLGDDFLAGAIEAYAAIGGDASAAVRHRIARYVAMREFFGLRWAVRNKVGFETEEQLQKIAAQFDLTSSPFPGR